MKGRRITIPPGMGTRPLLARIKKSLFDILAGRLPGARILDVYAGAGSFGLEAASRGAEEVVMVEADRGAARVIADNVSRVALEGRARVVRQDALAAMRALADAPEKFDVVFLDPPFRDDRAAELLSLADSLLADGGIAIIRVPRARQLPESRGSLLLFRSEYYGASKVGFYHATGRHC